jgi:hypothetical protein
VLWFDDCLVVPKDQELKNKLMDEAHLSKLSIYPTTGALALLSSSKVHHRVRLFIAVLVSTAPRLLATGDGRWPLVAPALSRPRAPAWRGHGRARPCWAKTALGRSPSRADSPLPRTRMLRPKAAEGWLVSMGRPSSNIKNCLLFFFYYLGREILWKCLCTHFSSKNYETNFGGLLRTRSMM